MSEMPIFTRVADERIAQLEAQLKEAQARFRLVLSEKADLMDKFITLSDATAGLVLGRMQHEGYEGYSFAPTSDFEEVVALLGISDEL